ncbi:ion transporter [Halomonas piscis]|uniref:Ion transporter n=1 Tax=Halomonas piscis TaxID=3031727 RepID=A0ABY9YXW4_9GAMM|nr:ion transporter [Halomonas piscis]WNK19725.1 ion transporter [Halomonas piscis]
MSAKPSFSPSGSRSRTAELAYLGWDVLIIAAVVANLTLLLVDSLYLIEPLSEGLEAVAPNVHAWYDRVIHQRFFQIDLAFVSLFVADVLLGWAMAIAERRYHRWFFYPFVRWYDVLGCIPLSGFRLLRALRVISLLHRLNRLRLIHIERWEVYRFVAKYYDILLEELSDRIAVRLLSNIQEQVRADSALADGLVNRVVAPRKEQLIREITQRIEASAGRAYDGNREEVMRYISEMVNHTLRESPEIRRLERLPMGSAVSGSLEASLAGVAHRLVDELARGIHTPRFRTLVSDTAESGFDAWLKVDEGSAEVTEAVLVDALEMLKEQISRQAWKDRYQ